MNEEAEIERLKAEWHAEIERSKIYCRAHEKLIELRDSQLKQYRLLLTRAADALRFYADPTTYFAILILPDPPCGEFASDTSPLDSDSEFIDYRGDGRSYYGKAAREILSELRKAAE